MEEIILEEIQKTYEEIILDEIRKSQDYTETKIYIGNLIDKIIESSILINKNAITQYKYKNGEAGNGSIITINNL